MLLIAALAAGCGPSSDQEATDESSKVSVVTGSASEVKTTIIGASPKQRAILLEILAGLGPTPIATIEVVDAERNWEGAAKDAVELRALAANEDRLASWHAELIAEALRVRSHELGLQPVAYLSAGRGGQMLASDPEKELAEAELTLAQAQNIAESIREAAAGNDAQVRRLELLRPRRLAFVLVLQTDNPAEFLLDGYEDVVKPLDELRGQGYDGRSIEVVDGEGKSVMEVGGWFWVRNDVAGCAPVIVSHPLGARPPPPCPASR